jgi:hypothetical protein
VKWRYYVSCFWIGHGKTGPATGTHVSQHARVREGTTAKKEGGNVVRGTEESDRAAALAPAQTEVRAGAVLLSGGRTEHQTPSTVPQPTDKAGSISHRVAELGKEEFGRGLLADERRFG